MARMKESVATTCWFLGFVISLCFVIFTITAQQPKIIDECNLHNSTTCTDSTTSTDCTTPPTCPKTQHCHFGFFLGWTMYMWMRIAIFCFLVSGGFLWPVVTTINSAVAEEGLYEEEYKAAVEEYSQARKDVLAAAATYKVYKAAEGVEAEATKKALKNFQDVVGAMNLAEEKKEASKPPRGMRRVVWAKSIRILYCLALVSLTVGAWFANISFFLSLEAEIGCVRKWAYYIPHALPAIIIAMDALHFGIDAWRHD